jgi:hypothetical protein
MLLLALFAQLKCNDFGLILNEHAPAFRRGSDKLIQFIDGLTEKFGKETVKVAAQISNFALI